MEINKLLSIAQEAGEEILKVYQGSIDVEYKDDKSPLTLADRMSNECILKGLSEAYPEIPILSEESRQADYGVRRNWKEFFLIDPLDGTKEFIGKNGEFTVNIALVRDGVPIIGVVYAPVTGEMYYTDGEKAYKLTGEERYVISPREQKDKFLVVASKSHFTDETKEYIEKLGKPYELVNIGSSLKLCLVAEGKADIYPRLGPTMEWDTAAAHAIVRAAGKKVYIYGTDSELCYNKEDLRNPWFVVR